MPAINSIISESSGYRYYLKKEVREPDFWGAKRFTSYKVDKCKIGTPDRTSNEKTCKGMPEHISGFMGGSGSDYNHASIADIDKKVSEENRNPASKLNPMGLHNYFDFFGKIDSTETKLLELIISAYKNEKNTDKKIKLVAFFYEALDMAAWGIFKNADVEKEKWLNKLLETQ